MAFVFLKCFVMVVFMIVLGTALHGTHPIRIRVKMDLRGSMPNLIRRSHSCSSAMNHRICRNRKNALSCTGAITETSPGEGAQNKSSGSIESNTTFLSKLKSMFRKNGQNGVTLDKKGLSKLGLNCLLAYGFVSNVSYITCLILSWITHGKSTGLSPLAPGQWKKFLLVYATFFAFNNVIRPLRFSLSLVITPIFDRAIELCQKKTGWSTRYSTGFVIFSVNVCGTFLYLFGGLFIATSIARVPLLPAVLRP